MSKTLYVLISDSGDGSYHPRFTLDVKLINHLQQAYDQDLMNYDNGIGVDGDGFHYATITVPEDSTPESLGISVIDSKYWFDKF